MRMLLPMKPDDQTLRTSWTLVARIKDPNDQTSWEAFDDLYRPLILGVAVKAGLRPDEAEDVVQETMASMCKHMQEFVPEAGRGSFRAWLLQMARWRIQDQFRKRLPGAACGALPTGSTTTTPTVERLPNPREVDLEALCDEAWKARLRETALKELQLEVKAEHYQVFHLVALEQKPIEDVARMVGRSRAHIYLIKHRVSNALKRIVKRLEKRMG
jgi:RNA polymerase sigma factor (sigma-70 family)